MHAYALCDSYCINKPKQRSFCFTPSFIPSLAPSVDIMYGIMYGARGMMC